MSHERLGMLRKPGILKRRHEAGVTWSMRGRRPVRIAKGLSCGRKTRFSLN